MIPKSRIRLSRSLRSQITPYPNVARFVKRGMFLALVILMAGIYFFLNNDGPNLQEKSLPKQILGEEQEAPVVEYKTYKVKKGDTLFNLAQDLGIGWQTLAEINNLQEPFVLRIGQEIKIPTPSSSPPR